MKLDPGAAHPSSSHADKAGSDSRGDRFANRRHQAVVNSQTELVCRFLPNGVLTFVNSAYCDRFGKSAAELLGQPLVNLVHPNEQGRVAQQLTEIQTLSPDSPVQTHEHWVWSATGEMTWYEWIVQGFFSLSGELIELQAVGRDVTRRKQMELELERYHQEQRTLNRILTLSLNAQSTPDVFRCIAEEVRQATGFPIVAIERYDTTRQTMVFEGLCGVDCSADPAVGEWGGEWINEQTRECRGACTHAPRLEFPVTETVSGVVLQTGQVLIQHYESEATVPGDRTSLLRALGIATFVCLPLTADGRTLGTLSLGHLQRQAVSPSLLEWLQSLSGAIAALLKRQETERSLQDSEQRYRLLFESNPLPMWVFDLDTLAFLMVNEAAVQKYGYSREEFLSMTLAEIRPPEEIPRLLAMISAVNQGMKDSGIWLHTKKDGSRIQVEITSYLLTYQGRRAELVIAKDVTEQLQIEAALRESQRKYETLFQTLPVGIAMTDACGRIVEVNPVLEEMLSIPAAEQTRYTCDRPAQPVLRPDSTPMLPEEFASVRALTEQQPVHNVEKGIVRTDGSVQWVNVCAAPIPLENYGVAIAYIDITQRKQAELALQDSETRWQTVVQSTNDGVFDADLITGKTFHSERWKTMLGHQPDEPSEAYEAWEQRIHPDDQARVMSVYEAYCQGALPQFRVEYRLRCKDGSYRWVLDRAQILRDEHGTPVRMIGTMTDIHHLKDAEEAQTLQAERERLLSRVTRHIHQSLDLSEILNFAVTDVRQLFQCDRALIYRFHQLPTRPAQAIVESSLPGWGVVLDDPQIHLQTEEVLLRQYGDSHRDRLANRPTTEVQSTRIDNIHTADISPEFRALLARVGVQSSLTVTINCDGNLWGLMCVHQCQSLREWQTWEIDLLVQLANQLAIAVQQSELYSQVQRVNAELETKVSERTGELRQSLEFEALLKRITDQVRDSLDERKILQTAVQELGQALGVFCCDTALYDADNRVSTIYCDYTHEVKSEEGTQIVMADYPDLYRQLLQGMHQQFCYANEVTRDRLLTRPMAKHCTIFSCPIRDDQGVLGDMVLLRPADEFFNEPEVRLVQQVANQCAIALRQSRLYQAAQAQVTGLARLNQLKDDFLCTISHELRTPVANVKMAAQMVETTLRAEGLLNNPTQPLGRYVQILQDECQREINLINDLLDLSRLDAEVDLLHPVPIHLASWISHIAEPFLDHIHRHQQHFSLDLPPDLPPLTTDLSHFERILTELLNNACKYTPIGERIEVRASLSSDRMERDEVEQDGAESESPLSSPPPLPHFLITITNTGVEIPPEECDRVFDRFYRIPSSDPWKHSGTGLGLALVKKLTKLLGGRVGIRSSAGQTTLWLRLPLVLRQ
ncbi:PAS domain S-box protein [Thermoleptolyngbya sp. C42_A2020_037]|uniref:PAS domain S-box protein n=1 Tax=Thermoleptolyngbya sp. C42_A2020_037 TaxID=2747799 RepID=UPI001A01014B|nr:PAS domain S-box protein [Thermoleptolyngbya sp. C42_A2020_037]MBF2083774.1 PAS domain S-box protein [Thermoleptolyngbya sp. C42_A2020_037]